MFLPLPIISVVVEPLGFEKCCIYTIVVEEKKCYSDTRASPRTQG